MEELGYSCEAGCHKRVYLDGDRGVCVCPRVYEPAEDTWLALEAIREIEAGGPAPLCVDVGSGTGVLGLECASRGSYTVMIDLSPCAARCSLLNARGSGLDALVDVVQCDNASCLRCPGAGAYIMYNTPYLPVEDEGIEALAWSGGIGEAERLAALVAGCPGYRCVVLVYSSLSGSNERLLDVLSKAGVALKKGSLHLFFEDIVVVYGCREPRR